MRKKLRSRRGETLAETLVAVLIVALSTVILATMTATAVRLDRSADQVTEDFYGALSAAETGSGAASRGGSVAITFSSVPGTNTSVPIVYYGEEDGLTAYRKGTGGAP